MNERLAFNLSGDKKVKVKHIKRRKNNSALNINQQDLRGYSFDKKAVKEERRTVVQYQGEDRHLVISNE